LLKIVDCIVDGHNLWLVLVAALVCILASHTTFSLWYRASTQVASARYVWLAAAAVSMGSGVWATHFVAMLAYNTSWPIDYDLTLTALSALIAVVVSGAGLLLAARGLFIPGGAVAGSAIGMMHYTGMAALRGSVQINWDLSYVAASLVFGIVAAALAFHQLRRREGVKGRIVVVALFALAICGMHFTAMTAATLTFDPWGDPIGASDLERQSMAIAVAAVAAMLLGAGMLIALLDSYLTDRNAKEAEQLRRYVSELETTQADLQETARNLSLALEAAAASSQAKSQFLATMSHELRTPLNAIIGFSELMKSESLGSIGNPRYIDYAGDIHASGTHLLSLINDVLDFSKSEAGRLDLHEEPVDVGEILTDCARLFAPGADDAGIEVTTEIPEAPLVLLVDRRRIKQIVLNLLSNAIKFTPTGGTVSLSLARRAEGIAITCADNGIGMSPEQIPIALDVFGQIDGRLSRNYQGTGLGLPLCSKLAEAHGASLSIDSALGEGTSVTVLLPAERLQQGRAA
jgi:signal transduction histidine kinase